MIGDDANPGVLPRAMLELLARASAACAEEDGGGDAASLGGGALPVRRHRGTLLRASYVELYNEEIRDLLAGPRSRAATAERGDPHHPADGAQHPRVVRVDSTPLAHKHAAAPSVHHLNAVPGGGGGHAGGAHAEGAGHAGPLKIVDDKLRGPHVVGAREELVRSADDVRSLTSAASARARRPRPR